MSALTRRMLCAVGVAVVAASGVVSAATLNVTSAINANHPTLSASAIFATSGTNLVITLTNTSAFDADVPSDMLTGIFFDIGGPQLSLTRTSAILAPGSIVLNDPQPVGGVVGGEWAYVSPLSGAPYGAKYGISSSGLNLFGPGDLFPGQDLEPPTSPNGVEYGITSASDPGNNNNGGAATPLIRNSVVFTLGGLPAGFDPMARISNISFQYGTGLDEPSLLVPVPGALGLLGLGGLAAFRRRR